MMYKGYEIVAEAITERAEYSLDDEGELNEYRANIDCEAEITCYGICDNGEMIDWADTIEEVKQCIDELDNYTHCKACDMVINIDKDKWKIINDNTFCKDCTRGN